MTLKKTTDSGEIDNNTGTDLQVLQSIEKAYFNNNKNAQKRNTQKSLKWFSQYIPRSYNKVRTSMLTRDRKLHQSDIIPGNVYFAVYDPIHKDKLPVWDEFPMLMPWDVWTNEKNGKKYVISINLHYLPPALRYKAMTSILKLKTENRYRDSTKLKLSWAMLKSMSNHKLFKHSVKMYRIDHFRSLFIKIPPRSWEMVVFLPLARFKKGNKSEAWQMMD